jgi:GT2 family glycosyltransferase
MARPTFSIVVPTHARLGQLAACLSALAQLNYSRDEFEVIVVDDGSPLLPMEIVHRFADQMAVRLIAQTRAGPAAARNAGAANATGDYLAFTDDDCTPDPNWLHALAAALKSWPDIGVGGQTINALPENPYSAASQSLVDYLYQQWNTDSAPRFFTSNNFAVPAAGFNDIGGFDPRFPFAAGEDRDLCDRWLARGFRLAYAPEAIVCHSHALTLHSFWRQHFNYGRGAYHFRRLRSQRNKRPINLESTAFYLKLISSPFADAWRKGSGWPVAMLRVLSQAANTAGFIRESLS